MCWNHKMIDAICPACCAHAKITTIDFHGVGYYLMQHLLSLLPSSDCSRALKGIGSSVSGKPNCLVVVVLYFIK